MGSSVNLIFRSVYDQMKIKKTQLGPVTGPLYGFSREKEAKGVITLPVTWGEGEKLYTASADFLIVDSLAT